MDPRGRAFVSRLVGSESDGDAPSGASASGGATRAILLKNEQLGDARKRELGQSFSWSRLLWGWHRGSAASTTWSKRLRPQSLRNVAAKRRAKTRLRQNFRNEFPTVSVMTPRALSGNIEAESALPRARVERGEELCLRRDVGIGELSVGEERALPALLCPQSRPRHVERRVGGRRCWRLARGFERMRSRWVRRSRVPATKFEDSFHRGPAQPIPTLRRESACVLPQTRERVY